MLSFGVTVLPDPPYTRLIELMQKAEEHGFESGWTYDSHILWQESYATLPLVAAATEKIKLGHCVTNPGIRDPTVTASWYATMQDISNGREVAWNEKELQLEWVRDELPDIPMHVAGYGPRALGVAGRVGDGVIIQLADPQIIQLIMETARKSAEEAGRAPVHRLRAEPRGRRSGRCARAGALVPRNGLEPRHGPDRALRRELGRD